LTEAITYRYATDDDLTTCTQIWASGIGDYYRNRLHQIWEPGDLEPLRRLLAHLRTTDPELFLVAAAGPADDARVLGFGSANRRGPTWYLSMLFIEPNAQSEGIGRGILTRLLPEGARHEVTPGAEPTRAERDDWHGTARAERAAGAESMAGTERPLIGTAVDSAQPISTGLYARFGMIPQVPVVQVVGRPTALADLPALSSGVSSIPFDELAAGPPGGPGHRALVDAIGSIDRMVLGYERPEDHRFLRLEGRRGFLFRGGDDAPIGYGYAAPSGRLGPVAALDPIRLATFTTYLLTAVIPPGANAIWVPGGSGDVLPMLLRAGLRIEGFPALLCWDRPVFDVSRYVPISLGLI
jgi:GNAT superfamily N-acetyltransferase